MKNFFIYTLVSIIIFLYLAFVLIPIGIILSIPLYFLTKNSVLKFHIVQMGLLALTFFLLSVIFFGSGIIFLHILVFIPYIIIFLILAILEVIYLIKNKKIKLPIFGEVAENLMRGNI